MRNSRLAWTNCDRGLLFVRGLSAVALIENVHALVRSYAGYTFEVKAGSKKSAAGVKRMSQQARRSAKMLSYPSTESDRVVLVVQRLMYEPATRIREEKLCCYWRARWMTNT